MKNVELYKEHHKKVEVYGGGGALKFHLQLVVDVILDTKSKTLLDYGCGKATVYTDTKIHEKWGGILPSLYDPAIAAYEKLPDGPFHGVFSVDVMEHIPYEELDEVLKHIFDRAERFVFLAISTEPAKAILSNGENAHCTVENTDWWEQKIIKANTQEVYTHLHTYGHCNDYRIYYENQYLDNMWSYNE